MSTQPSSRWEALAGACGGELRTNADTALVGFSAAIFSRDQQYRYALVRRWDPSRHSLIVIGLNPSTATEIVDDPTIKRCTVRATTMKFGGLIMVNIFAFRATDPKAMMAVDEPVGPANDVALRTLCANQNMVIAAWGTHGGHRGRQDAVVSMLTTAGVSLYAFKETIRGYPQHPLYLSYSAQPFLWKSPEFQSSPDADVA